MSILSVAPSSCRWHLLQRPEVGLPPHVPANLPPKTVGHGGRSAPEWGVATITVTGEQRKVVEEGIRLGLVRNEREAAETGLAALTGNGEGGSDGSEVEARGRGSSGAGTTRSQSVFSIWRLSFRSGAVKSFATFRDMFLRHGGFGVALAFVH